MKQRIIVLDDDSGIRHSLTILLGRYGYEVISSPDPTLCPVFIGPDKSCPHEDVCGDFLLTDNQMPKMTGLEFVEHQKLRGCKGLIANKAVMSGSWSAEEIEKAEELGCKIFIKPVLVEEILEWLNKQKISISPDRKLADLGKVVES